MAGLIAEIKYFWSKRCFAISIPLMMLLSYGTLLLNPTIGIDDTSFKIYYIDGVSPAMGRWCLYMIHKILPLDYNPFFVEAMGLCFFCLSITLWCIVFYRLFGEKISVWSYVIFGGVMLSSPIISEVVIWYLQDGIYLGYGVTALAVLVGMQTFDANISADRKKRLLQLLACGALLAVALGFYESFMIVFLMAMVMIFMVIRVVDHNGYSRKPLDWLLNMIVVCVSCMVFRTLAINSITAFFHLEDQANVLASRGFGDILGQLLSWFDGTKSVDEFTFVLKDFVVKYYFNAVVYTPIMILVLAVGVLGVLGLYHSVRRKDGWIIAAVLGILILPWILPVLEGVATYYRSSQYIPLLTAFVVLLVAWAIRNSKINAVRYAALIIAFVLLYHQGYEMNRWLYVDAMKYEDTKRTMDSVALHILENCDADKPICVIGNYQTPEGLIEDVYCPIWSKKYDIIMWLVKGLDEELFEKYNTPMGYATAETPQLSFITWGATAFYGFDRELIKFWNMHGFSFTEDGNLGHYDHARAVMKNGPVWPEAGSIVETDDNIIVNFGNY